MTVWFKRSLWLKRSTSFAPHVTATFYLNTVSLVQRTFNRWIHTWIWAQLAVEAGLAMKLQSSIGPNPDRKPAIPTEVPFLSLIKHISRSTSIINRLFLSQSFPVRYLSYCWKLLVFSRKVTHTVTYCGVILCVWGNFIIVPFTPLFMYMH
jgi:hypothetical protein